MPEGVTSLVSAARVGGSSGYTVDDAGLRQLETHARLLRDLVVPARPDAAVVLEAHTAAAVRNLVDMVPPLAAALRSARAEAGLLGEAVDRLTGRPARGVDPGGVET